MQLPGAFLEAWTLGFVQPTQTMPLVVLYFEQALAAAKAAPKDGEEEKEAASEESSSPCYTQGIGGNFWLLSEEDS